MLKHCAANRKRRLSALPNVGPYIYIYIYTTVKFLALEGAPYIYDISRLRVNYLNQGFSHVSLVCRKKKLSNSNASPKYFFHFNKNLKLESQADSGDEYTMF
jgi:hypothetical protein